MKRNEKKRKPIIVEKDNNGKNLVKGYSETGDCFPGCAYNCAGFCGSGLCQMNCSWADPASTQASYLEVWNANFSLNSTGSFWSS